MAVVAPGTALAGKPFVAVVTAVDSYGNTIAGYTGTVHLTSSDSQAALQANSTLTDGVGYFTVRLRRMRPKPSRPRIPVSTAINGHATVSVNVAAPVNSS